MAIMDEPKVLASDGETISRDSISVLLLNDSSDALNPEFNPDYHFYLAFAALAVVTLAAGMHLLIFHKHLDQ